MIRTTQCEYRGKRQTKLIITILLQWAEKILNLPEDILILFDLVLQVVVVCSEDPHL